MKCPSCGENTPDSWSPVLGLRDQGGWGPLTQPTWFRDHDGELIRGTERQIQFDRMHCANPGCGQLVVRGHEHMRLPGHLAPEDHTTIWLVYPRSSSRLVDALVPEQYAKDYREAAALLDLSPRMSAVLSRKVVFDLLEDYAKISEYTLKGSLDKFIADTAHPARIRENLQHLREIGDFGAHTKKDGIGQVIDVSREDAEWTLDLIDRLFDYFVLDPERDKKLRATWDQNVQEAGRKPIPPVPPDPGVPST